MFHQMGLPDKEIVPITTTLVRFDEASIVLMVTIKLEITVRDKLLMIDFAVVNATSLYNIIMGRG